jgi:hypothetical protein
MTAIAASNMVDPDQRERPLADEADEHTFPAMSKGLPPPPRLIHCDVACVLVAGDVCALV